jgi:hypothetical protein
VSLQSHEHGITGNLLCGSNGQRRCRSERQGNAREIQATDIDALDSEAIIRSVYWISSYAKRSSQLRGEDNEQMKAAGCRWTWWTYLGANVDDLIQELFDHCR